MVSASRDLTSKAVTLKSYVYTIEGLGNLLPPPVHVQPMGKENGFTFLLSREEEIKGSIAFGRKRSQRENSFLYNLKIQ